MENFYFSFFEFGALFTLLLIFFKERKNKEMLKTLIFAFLYGVLLELFDVHLSGSYSYSRDFVIRIFDVPIAIGLGWAIIYYCARKSAEAYPLKWWQAPLLMALLAVSIDLVFDIVAIRLGFWQWRIPMNQEWFGVPYDNLFGWMAVIWTFAFLVNLSGQKIFSRGFSRIVKYSAMIASPLLPAFQISAYVGLSAILSGRFSPDQLMEFSQSADFGYAYQPAVQTAKMYLFWAIVVFLALHLARAIYKNRQKMTGKIDWLAFWILTATYSLFLAAIFTAGLYQQMPIFIAIAGAMLAFHLFIGLLPKYKGA